MDVTVVVPFLPGDGDRDAAWAFVRRWHTKQHGWPIVVARPLPGPWVKASAVTAAVQQCATKLVVVADADVITAGLTAAVEACEAGAAWAIPHRLVHRLNARASRAVMDGADPSRFYHDGGLLQRPYSGAPGGGIVVLHRDTYLDVPLDPRFVGWGGEDYSWGDALLTLVGRPHRESAPLYHLWHKPQERQTRKRGSAESEALRERYRLATGRVAEMRTLVEEAKCWAP